MAEPSTMTAGIAIALGTVTLTGGIFGVQYDALLAGYFAPICAAASINYFAWLSGVGDFARLACAVSIGFS